MRSLSEAGREQIVTDFRYGVACEVVTVEKVAQRFLAARALKEK